MSVANHRRRFRPVPGGALIFQPASGEAGTLGAALTSDGADRWLLTCFHVLARRDGRLVLTDTVLQPDAAAGVIADLRVTRADQRRDVIAARLAVDAMDHVLGIGRLAAPKQPQVGMTVVKSGWKTGVSEGVIRDVVGADVVIERRAGYPADYLLAAVGDSGSIWVEAGSRAPVAVHKSESTVGEHVAFATNFVEALLALDLRQAG